MGLCGSGGLSGARVLGAPVPDIQLKPLPAAEAVAYFRQKGYRVGFDYRDVERQEHQAAFTVAKAMQIDLLQDIRGELDKALADGTTFADFKRALRPRLIDRGWWGRQEVTDPVTGERQVAQLGSPRRLAVIFDTNLATAYSEGQDERIQRNKGIFGFLEYVQTSSLRPDPAHLKYVGLVLPVDDPFWPAHKPVKRYGCKCGVIQHTGRTLAREGLQVGKAPPEVMRTVANKRTGEELQVPVGVDPAFHYPPGGRRANLGKWMMDKADAAGAVTTARVLAQGADTWAELVQTEFEEFVGRYAEGERREIGHRRVAGLFAPEVVGNLQAAGVLPQHATVFADMRKLHHLLGDARTDKRKAKGVGVGFVGQLPLLLRQVGEAWLDGRRVVLLCTSPEETARVAKVVVDLDVQVHRGTVGNSVVSMELIQPQSFTRKGLVRLDGENGALR